MMPATISSTGGSSLGSRTPTICPTSHSPPKICSRVMAAWVSTAAGHHLGRGGLTLGTATAAPRVTAISSSASGSRSAPRTAVSRTACAHGSGSPDTASSATARTACSTR